MPVLDPRPTLEAPDDDPYLWLEEIEGAQALDFVAAQSAATLRRFGDARFAAERDILKAILDRPDNIPYPNRRAGKLFNPWQDAAHPRGVWRTTTLASFVSDAPDWDVLIDVDALAAKDGEDWVWRGAVTLPPAHERAIAYLSRGGADATVLREFDLATRDFVRDGFNLGESKSSAVWLDRDTLLLSSPLGSGMATRSGYARTVRLWRRGSDPLSASVVFETTEEATGVWTIVDRDVPEERVWFVEQLGLIDANVWIGDRNGRKTRIDVPPDCWVQASRGWLAIKPRTPWNVGGETYETDTVVAMSLPAFVAGERRFTTLFKPSDRRALQGFFWCGGRLVLSILDDLKPVFEVLTPDGGAWSRARIAGLPDLGTAHVWPLDVNPEESNGDLLALAHDQLTPPSLFLIKPAAASSNAPRRPSTRPGSSSPGTKRSRATARASPMCRPARRAKPARRRSISPAMAVSASRCRPITTPPSASCGWNGAARRSSPICAAGANSARLGTKRRAVRVGGSRTTISRRSPLISSGVG
jgi:prolyl oligopeptidase